MIQEIIRNAEKLIDLSERLVGGLDKVHLTAGRELRPKSTASDPFAPAGVGKAIYELQMIYTLLRKEPFLARVEVEWDDTGEEEVFYICRGVSSII